LNCSHIDTISPLLAHNVFAVHRKRAELMQLAELFQGEIVDVGVEHVTIMLTAWPKRIDALIELARP
jgi:acetolactate synthase small subunit